MAARVIDAKYSTLVGTPAEIRELVLLLAGGGKDAAVVDLKFSNFVVTARPVDSNVIAKALETTPRVQRA